MGSSHSHEEPVSQSEDPKAPLSLPIQNRRVLRGAALSPPDAAQGPGGPGGLPIKNRRTRGVTLEPPAAGRDVAEQRPVGYPEALRGPPSPGKSSPSPGLSSPQSRSGPSARYSRVHFATSPASVVEITPYSWASSASSPVFESPTSPTMWVNGNGVTLGSPVHGYPAVPGPASVAMPVMLPLQAQAMQPAPPMLPQQVFWRAPVAATTSRVPTQPLPRQG
ncbi:unnamed protein product [Durusdinium trenchii]|uniref:Uncharacterized protein n=2 Tax=Durusdinium trenchii TaxID=1381693 RepID=A0ABP0Q8Z6_9DINO